MTSHVKTAVTWLFLGFLWVAFTVLPEFACVVILVTIAYVCGVLDGRNVRGGGRLAQLLSDRTGRLRGRVPAESDDADGDDADGRVRVIWSKSAGGRS